jgi:hypothetical protein
VGTGAKEDESSAGHVWAAGFHHVTARSRLAGVLKLSNRLFIYVFIYLFIYLFKFPVVVRAAVNRGC